MKFEKRKIPGEIFSKVFWFQFIYQKLKSSHQLQSSEENKETEISRTLKGSNKISVN